MIVQPKFRGFICTTSHPLGCSVHVKRQIDYVRGQKAFTGPKNVLIIGASTGYGLASRIATAFGAGAKTLGVFYERPASGNRTATPGWYNTAAFEREAHKAGLYAVSINGDAFSNQIKQQAIDTIKADLGKIDLVVYSLAAPRRVDPITNEIYTSVLKPIGRAFTSKTVDFHSGEVSTVTIEAAAEEEIAATVKVMGGEDWQLWIEALLENGVLADGCTALAYSYIGPEITHAVYRSGTIGKAKEHLEATAQKLNRTLAKINGRAYVSVNKAVVTQASAAIPVVPLYASLLFKVMKEKKIHEGCIEQIYRLFTQKLTATGAQTDSEGRIRLDDWEMRPDVQEQVVELWEQVNSGNIAEISDLAAFRTEFFNLFGFEFPEVDYAQDVDVAVAIPSIDG
jgi:enoyl-[acyl-carrier protein] reductase/trans-2-enoyl-CoA reductase (NAD+)